MPDPAIVVNAFGVAAATVAGAVALYNARKAALWKRAELASTQLKELLSNEELVFACRCLDWNGGVLVVPKSLQPLLSSDAKTIDHDISVFTKAISAALTLDEMAKDTRLQIYRTATDTLLGWLSATDSAIERKLYTAADIEDAGYWLRQAYRISTMAGFIHAFGYRKSMDRLARRFNLVPPEDPLITSRGGLGGIARGQSFAS